MATNFEEMIEEFYKTGKTQYSSYYSVKDKSKVLLNEYEYGKVKVISLVIGDIIFINENAFSRRTRDNVSTLRTKSLAFSKKVYKLPACLNESIDLTNITILDRTYDNVLLDMDSNRFAILTIPNITLTYESFLKEPKGMFDVVIFICESNTKTVEEAVHNFLPKELKEGSVLINGTWIIPTGWSLEDKPEFLPTKEEVKKLYDIPVFIDKIPPSFGSLGDFARLHLSVNMPFSSSAYYNYNRLKPVYPKEVLEHEEKVREHRLYAERFKKKFLSFPKDLFGSSYDLVFDDNNPSNVYTNDSGETFIIGGLANNYNTSASIKLKTWSKIIPPHNSYESIRKVF